jgi:hypothetical protein
MNSCIKIARMVNPTLQMSDLWQRFAAAGLRGNQKLCRAVRPIQAAVRGWRLRRQMQRRNVAAVQIQQALRLRRLACIEMVRVARLSTLCVSSARGGCLHTALLCVFLHCSWPATTTVGSAGDCRGSLPSRQARAPPPACRCSGAVPALRSLSAHHHCHGRCADGAQCS